MPNRSKRDIVDRIKLLEEEVYPDGVNTPEVATAGESGGLESVNTDREFTKSRSADVYVHRSDGRVYVDGPNGTIDDQPDDPSGRHTALQSALKWAGDNNGHIHLPAGEYTVNDVVFTHTAGLSGSDGFTISGAGKGATVLKSSEDLGTFTSLLVIGDFGQVPEGDEPAYVDVGIRDLTLDHTAQEGSDSSPIVFNVNVQDSIIENVRTLGGTLYNIDISDCTNVTVRNCVLDSPAGTFGLYLYHNVPGVGEDKHQIENNTIRGGARGIVHDGAVDCNVEDNLLEDQTSAAISVSPTDNYPATGNTYKNNRIYNCGGAEAINTSGDGTEIVDNRIIDPDGRGILVVGDTSAKTDQTTDARVRGNYIRGQSGWAIRHQSVTDCVTSENVIQSDVSGSDGIQLKTFASEPTEDNRLRDNDISVPDLNYDDSGTRTLIDGVGKNAGDPTTAGDWNGSGEEGVQVVDNTNNVVYHYRGGEWV